MAAFDTALEPASVTPGDTSETTLFTASDDSSVLVAVTNITEESPGSPGEPLGDVSVRVGITPSGGSVHWKVFDVTIAANDALLNVGPWFLQSGDVVTVSTDLGDAVTFSLTGVESS